MSSNGNDVMSDNMPTQPFSVPTARPLATRNSAGCTEGHEAMEASLRALRVDKIADEASIEVLHDNVFKLRKEKIEAQDTMLRMASEIRQLQHFRKMILEKARLIAPHSEDMIKATLEGNYDSFLEQRAFTSAENVGLVKDKVAKEGNVGQFTAGKSRLIRAAIPQAFKATDGVGKSQPAMTLEEEVFGPPISKGDDPELVGVKQMLYEARRLSQNDELCSEEKLSQDKPLPVIEKNHTLRGRMYTLKRRVSQVFVKEN